VCLIELVDPQEEKAGEERRKKEAVEGTEERCIIRKPRPHTTYGYSLCSSVGPTDETAKSMYTFTLEPPPSPSTSQQLRRPRSFRQHNHPHLNTHPRYLLLPLAVGVRGLVVDEFGRDVRCVESFAVCTLVAVEAAEEEDLVGRLVLDVGPALLSCAGQRGRRSFGGKGRKGQ
jgi:hypothetical protein